MDANECVNCGVHTEDHPPDWLCPDCSDDLVAPGEVRCVCCDKPSGFTVDSSGEYWCGDCPECAADPVKTPIEETE